jgi:nitrate reductase gamma subunit
MSGHVIQMIAGILAVASLATLILRRRVKAVPNKRPADRRR